jgi:hypothetical protein
MRISINAKTANAILRLPAIVILALLILWHFVFDNVAVYRSISLAPGTVNQRFRLNYSGDYRMGIEVERKFRHPVLQCLLGITGTELLDSSVCKDNPAVLKYSWQLTCDGSLIRTGSSDHIDGGAYTTDTMEAQFGTFEGKRGDHCHLALTFLGDASKLSVANPKLRIYIELL